MRSCNPCADVVLQNVGSETGSGNVGIMTGQDEAVRDGTGTKTDKQTDGGSHLAWWLAQGLTGILEKGRAVRRRAMQRMVRDAV